MALNWALLDCFQCKGRLLAALPEALPVTVTLKARHGDAQLGKVRAQSDPDHHQNVVAKLQSHARLKSRRDVTRVDSRAGLIAFAIVNCGLNREFNLPIWKLRNRVNWEPKDAIRIRTACRSETEKIKVKEQIALRPTIR